MKTEFLKTAMSIGSLFFLGTTAAHPSRAADLPAAIHLAGDSTMADKRPAVYPETGWGQALKEFTAGDVKVRNHATDGRSTKSFIDEGRWGVLVSELLPGDVVFIQFGHNDQKADKPQLYAEAFGDYSTNLCRFVTEVRGKGATPVLVTSIARRFFNEDGRIKQSLGRYPEAMRAVAVDMQVPLIDLNVMTTAWLEELGPEKSKAMFVWTDPDERYPEGRKDNSHLSVTGARIVAGMVVDACIRGNLAFAKALRPKGSSEISGEENGRRGADAASTAK